MNVERNEAESRYELAVEGALAVAAYEERDGALAFTHTLVPPELRGRGIGGRLIQGALDDARARGLKVVPLCPFVAAFIEEHPDYAELVA